SYLPWLRDCLTAAREMLTESGSIFVQIGDDNVHLVRSVLDEVFGSENTVSLITFKKTTGAGSFAGGPTVLPGVYDILLWYARSAEHVKYRQLYRPREVGGAGAGQYTQIELADGTRRRATPAEQSEPPAETRLFRHDQLTSQSSGQPQFFPFELAG